MKLSIPYNGLDELIPRLSGYRHVGEIYGKLTADFIGGGKNSFQIMPISRSKLKKDIRKARQYGIKFNYLLNSTCLNNAEMTAGGQRRIRKLLDWVIGLDVDAVTISMPYFIDLIKKCYPGIKVYVSVLAGVNSLQRAKYWEDLGADRVTLFNLDTNRDFSLLKDIRKEVKCQLSIILNSNCLYKCPFYIQHANTASHASQSNHFLKGFVIDYCRLRCRYLQLIEPTNFIRSTWIRPEDLHHYEKAGIDYFKIIDRGMNTETLLKIVEAYAKRTFNGNLLDLFPDPSKAIISGNRYFFYKMKYFFRPFSVNIFKLKKFSNLVNNAIYIDNNKLSGFIEKLIEKDCSKNSCKECGLCSSVANESINIKDPVLNNRIKEAYKSCLDELISGRLFKY